ncbi:MAG TPA: hypothetical protein DD411_02425 [Alcanivorax sp.]|jgi:hypothetical protein|nr:hypothetical protein [Alcanivorax sp.]HBM22411.1 hypothetical protein [Alcanivorax sp.]|tara:strand:- start:186 stop:410 length:225 start_codon:yes stop_codon:yes gene_type:complete
MRGEDAPKLRTKDSKSEPGIGCAKQSELLRRYRGIISRICGEEDHAGRKALVRAPEEALRRRVEPQVLTSPENE